MARISTYPILSTPTVNDLLIGTDVENLNETKNFSIGDIGSLIGQDYVPYVGATGNVNLGSFNITAAAFIIPGGLASQFVKADGSLDSTAYTPQTRTLTINGTTYNLSANRSWDLNTIDSLTTTGTSGAATYIGKVLNIPVYQAQGNYITQLSGEATGSGPGNASVTLSNSAVIGKVLTGLNVTGGTVVSTDSILQAFGKVQNQINGLTTGVTYQGVWNAATNVPFLQSSVGTKGYYYVVDVAGNTNLNGITDWKVGDWAIYNGTAWDKVDNTDAVVSVNGYVGAVVLTASDVGAVPTTRTLTINGVGYNLSADRAWTVGDVRTDGSYANPSWITSLGWSKITGTPTTLSGYGITDGALNTTTLTINGTTYDLTANRTWNVGTVTSVGTSGPLTGGTITGSGTIGITQAGASSDGYLSSTDWNAFNSKQAAISVTAPITLVAGVLGITQSGASSDGYLSSTDWNTFNSKVSGSGTANTLPMWGSASSLINSPLSYAADTFNFQYNSATGGTVNFTNIGLTAYTYSIQMNNFGSPRSTIHSYTDGLIIQSIGGTQVSRMFANGNFILGTGTVDNGYKLEITGNLYVNTIANATVDTDRFIVSDGGVIKYRTGAEILTDIGAQGALTLTTIGTSGPATLISNTLNIPNYGSALTGYVPYTGATQDLNLGTYGLIGDFVRFNPSSSNIPSAEGVMSWDNTDGTVRLSVKGNTYSVPIGQSVVARVRNSTGTNLLRTNYQVVKVAGAQGQRLAVSLAQANNDANSASTLGLVCENISTNQEGFIVNIGQIVNVNTTGNLQGETWLDGDVLYLSPTIAGAITNIKPVAPQHTVILGYVEYAHANNGKIYVKIDNGYELEELHDVSAEPFINNGLLYRDTTLNLWKSATIDTILGYTPAPQGNYITSLTGEATASGPGAASVTLSNSAVTGKVLTGLNITGNAIVSTDSILTAFGKLQHQVNQLVGGLQYEGTWNASTNTPTITSSVGTDGTFYIVSVAGTTNINGINDWQVGDWIVFHDTTWQKVDNSDSVSSVFGRVGNIVANQADYSAFYPLIADIKNGVLTVQGTGVLSGSGTFSANQATNNTITLTHAAVSRTDTISAQTPSFGGSFTAIDSVTSSAEGHITAINTKTITVPSTVATATQTGLLSSTDWTTFNSKQNALTNPVTGTGTTNVVPKFTGTSTIGDSSIQDNTGEVSISKRLFLNTGGQSILLTPNLGSSVNRIESSNLPLEITTLGSALRLAAGGVTAQLTLASTGVVTLTNLAGTGSRIVTADASGNLSASSALSGYVQGSGTTNYLPKFTGSTTIGNSNLINDASGNLGLGVTPSAWISAYRAFNIGLRGFVYSRTDTQETAIGTNWYRDSNGSFLYTANGFASYQAQQDSVHYWYNAPSGTAGNAITFTQAMTLDASGNLLIGATSNISSARREIVIRGANGSLLSLGNNTTADRFQIVSDSGENALLNNKASTPMIFYTSNTERARFTSGGNVLIGTTTDIGQRLQVSGGYIAQVDGGVRTFLGYDGTGSLIGTTTNHYFRFITNDTERMRITSSGNVGIGTASPNGKLRIQNDNSTIPSLIVRDGGTPTANLIEATSNAYGNSFIVTATGNVGIGTTSPMGFGGFTNLTIASSTTSNQSAIFLVNSSVSIRGSWYQNAGTQINFGTATNHPLVFDTNDTERMRITSGGNVLIGTTSDNGARLQVSGAGTFSGSVTINNASIYNRVFSDILPSNDAQGVIYVREGNVSGADGLRYASRTHLFQSHTGSNYLAITSGGNVLIGTTTDNGARLQVSGAVTITSGGGQLTLIRTSFNTFQFGTGIGSGISGLVISDITAGINPLIIAQSTGAATFSSSAFNVATFNSTFGQMAISFANNGTTFSQIGSGVSVCSTAAADDLGFGTAGLNKNIVFATGTGFTERMRITSSGNVGIGTTSPTPHNGTNALVVQGGSGSRGIMEIWDNSGAGGKAVFQQVGGDTYLGSLAKGSGSGDLFLLVNGTGTSATVSTIFKASGNVLIGTTTDVGARLYVDGAFRTGTLTAGTQTAAVDWRLGNARGGSATANALIRVQINGVLVDLIGNYV